jgi:hypothetical protein
VAVARLLEPAAGEALGQDGALVFGDRPLVLEQGLIIRIVHSGTLQEDHVAVGPAVSGCDTSVAASIPDLSGDLDAAKVARKGGPMR